ncbi:MAG: FAD-binding oxidoreductase [Nitrososphaerota archaeon]
MKKADVVVIGGGIIGSFVSYYLGLRGLDVTLIEAGQLGNGASGKCAGIHTTQLVQPIDIVLASRSKAAYEELAGDSISRTGFISVEPSWMSAFSSELLAGAGVKHEIIDNSELRAWLSWMRVKDYEVAVYTPDDIVIDVSSLFKTLRGRLEEAGVELKEWIRVERIDPNRRVLDISGPEQQVSFEKAVFSAGAWNREVLINCGIWRVPVVVYACQIVSFKFDEEIQETPVFLEENHVYLRRFSRHTMLVGNGRAIKLSDPSECPSSPEYDFIEELSVKLYERLQRPDSYRLVGGWTGVCSSSPDGNPLLGQIPGRRDLYIIDALDGYGLMRGPALSQDLAEYICGEGVAESIRLFNPSRFNGYSGEPEEVIELHSRM